MIKKYIKNTILVIFMISTLLLLIANTSLLIEEVHQTVKLWALKVFPVLFPFYILGSLFVTYGVAHFIGGLLSPFTRALFRTRAVSGFIFLIGVLSGNPQSAVMVSELYNKGSLDEDEASHLLKFSVFANPLFCLGTIGIGYFHNMRVGMIILVAHILSNVILGILLRFKRPKEPFVRPRPYEELSKHQTNKPFGEVLTLILQKGLNIQLLVCGFMIFFKVLVLLLREAGIISILHTLMTLNGLIPISYTVFEACIVGIFEMVSSIDYLYKTELDLRWMISLMAAFISFGGLSIHAQIQSVLEKVKIAYRPFLIYRFYQMLIAGTLAYFLFPSLYKEASTETGALIGIKIDQFNILITIGFLTLLLFLLRFTSRSQLQPSHK